MRVDAAASGRPNDSTTILVKYRFFSTICSDWKQVLVRLGGTSRRLAALWVSGHWAQDAGDRLGRGSRAE